MGSLQADNLSENKINKTKGVLKKVQTVSLVLLALGALTVGLTGLIQFVGGLFFAFGLIGSVFSGVLLVSSNSK